MFGCLRRLVSLVVLLVIAGVAWVTRDRWLPVVRTAIGASPGSTPADAARADSLAALADTGWVPVTYSAAERGRAELARLRARKGPALVRLAPADFAGLVLDSLDAQLPRSADSLAVRVQGRELQVRMSVKLGDLGGQQVLGPLAGMLGDRERLLLGGELETGAAGTALLRLRRVRLGDFGVPGPVIPKLAAALRRTAGAPGTEGGTLALPLPDGVGDVRVADGRVTLYRPVP
ncbi:MAG: hypothetical protein MUF21_01670 [Gemmatimonadaceae bacterium]|nr:hypothetical protein [Gemmatimonadaceae bacterium]